MKKETKLWFDLAEDDYKNALLLWENRRYGATVFFFQQAAEKILKAYIIEFKHKAPVKTHRIELLIREAGLDLEEINKPKTEELSKAYIRVRYPDLSRKYYRKRADIETLVKIAKEVYLWIKNKFKKA